MSHHFSDAEVAKRVAECDTGDKEGDHYDADYLLCEALEWLGYTKTVEAYKALPKWYA